ncbi:TetR/AcrR family transcriptional regulator [Dokdonella sp.]|uniref:TetR/AcrR family transcriptional regulator n=1 Tax=Dokdonella sp. TaxID=2291710 RepID=UPI00262F540E|nr:TetR/AcrR family transcriptional regulator [Dokdonella sp.]
MQGDHRAATAKGAATRSHIVDRALDMVRVGGFDGLSIGSVAETAAMSKSGVFAHFGSREELQLAVLDAAAERFTREVFVPALRAPRGLPRLRSIVAHWLEWLRLSEGGCPMVGAAVEFDDQPGLVRERVVFYEERLRAELVRAVRMAVETGDLRADTDAEQVAFELFAIALASHHDYRLLGDASPRGVRALERLIEFHRV